MNQESRNLVTFVLVAALIMLGWTFLAPRFGLVANPPVTKVVNGRSIPVANPTAGPVPQTTGTIRDRKLVLAASPRVAIDTPTLKGSINLAGGRIDDLVLAGYKESIAKDSPPIRLLSPSGAADAYFAQFGWSGDGVTAPGDTTVYTASAPVLRPGQPVTLSWTSPTGQRFATMIAVDDNFMFTVRQSIGNGAAKPVTVRPFALISRTGASKDQDIWINHVGPVGVFGNGADYDVGYPNLDGKDPSFFSRIFGNSAKAGDNYFDATGGWLGFSDKYWLAAIVPDQGLAVHSGFRLARPGTYQADFTGQPTTLPPGKELSVTTRLFAGAKENNLLDRYEDQLRIRHFGKAIDWGWFEILEKPIFKYLTLLFHLIGNFGVAILLLTFTIRGLLFPLAQRQFASMANMKAIQPKMKAIQEKHKDDKARAQQEVMALYKSEKINPLAGCLPVLIQAPIMFSLYKVLQLSIEMRHQPFALWIRDLSAPDPATVLNLFGYLHFPLPAFLAIGVVPILLGVSMFFQFRLNPAPMDEAQKQVFALMPWVLMFVMAPFAVGLQLYWITSNCITIAQQQWLYSRHPALKQKPA